MRLFGEHGYTATTVAEIEAAAGLSPGSGGLYTHFRSKQDLLRAGLESVLSPPPTEVTSPAATARATATATGKVTGEGTSQSAPPLAPMLEGIARAGLARLQQDRDFNRVLVRDLRSVPELLQMSADREIRPVHKALADVLLHAGLPDEVDGTAAAAVLIGAISHYWLFVDIFGSHPAEVSENAFITALVRMADAVLSPKESS